MAASDLKYSNIQENEKSAIEDELNEYTKLSKGDKKEERLIDLSAKEAQEQPDVGTIIESVARMKWQESSGDSFNGSGFLGKLMLGGAYRLGFFTAGHNFFDKGTQQVVNTKSVKLLFKDIKKLTNPVLLSKLMCEPNVLVVAYEKIRITVKDGQTDIQPCRDGIDFAALIFTGKIEGTEKFLRKLGLSFLTIGEPGTCGSKPSSSVQLYGFPQYVPDSPMRILPGVELTVPVGNIPDHCYTLETKSGASGASVSDKGGRIIAIHIRGLKKIRGDQGNWGIGFDIIREELLQCLNISSLASQVQPRTSDSNMAQGMSALATFLKKMNIEKYIPIFESEDIDMDVLEECEPEELGPMLEKLGVTLGHNKKIVKALRNEKQENLKGGTSRPQTTPLVPPLTFEVEDFSANNCDTKFSNERTSRPQVTPSVPPLTFQVENFSTKNYDTEFSKVGTSRPQTTPLVPPLTLKVEDFSAKNYDTEFSEGSKILLGAYNLINKTMVRNTSASPTSVTIRWTQIKRCLFGCEEEYLLVNYNLDGNVRNPVVNVYVASSVLSPPDEFNTSGYQKFLHFGFLHYDGQDPAIFFVLHPNSWGPFQHRFKTNAFTDSFVKSVGHVYSPQVGGKSIIESSVGHFSASYFGDYLRFIG